MILERILVFPCDEISARFPCAQQKSFVRVVVLLQDKKRDIQSRSRPLVHVWSVSQSFFKLLSHLFLIVKENLNHLTSLSSSSIK